MLAAHWIMTWHIKTANLIFNTTSKWSIAFIHSHHPNISTCLLVLSMNQLEAFRQVGCINTHMVKNRDRKDVAFTLRFITLVCFLFLIGIRQLRVLPCINRSSVNIPIKFLYQLISLWNNIIKAHLTHSTLIKINLPLHVATSITVRLKQSALEYLNYTKQINISLFTEFLSFFCNL